MYSILKNIFNREYNEGYANRNRSNFAGGLADLRNGWAAMQNARKNKQDQAEYKNSMGNGGGNQYPNGSIGATGDGIYGVNSMPPQPNGGGIGVDANGVYGVSGATPQPNQSVFSGGNGFDWSKVSPIPKENSVMDYWNNNQPQNPMFSGMGGGKESDHGMNITDQTIGQNYNNRIDSQYGADKSGGMTGMNFPQTPQGNGGFNSVFNGANANPLIPSISSSNLAQGIGGQNVSANDLSKYLGNEYNRAAWIQQDMANNGVTNPLISMLRYDTKVAPLINAAKEEELRNAFFTLNNPNASEQDRMNAMALIEFRKGDPFLEEEFMAKLGYVPDDGYGGYSGYGGYGEDGGEYGGEDENARAIYNHLVNKGLPANVIAGIMGNLQAESGFNSSAVGDEGNSIGLAQWYAGRGDNLRNFAQQRGTEWNDIGTQLDFLLDEVAKGNPELLNRMANLSPHEAAILFHDEFEKSADTPEMKARRGDYATDIYNGRRQGNGTRRSRWKQNPYKMTPMQRMQYAHDLKMEEIAARQAYKDGGKRPLGSSNKNEVGMRQAAMNLAGLQNVAADDTKGQENYTKAMDGFVKNIVGAYNISGSSADSNSLGVSLYRDLNKTKSGLRPETLARAAATAIYLVRGDVDAGDLQRYILQQVYSQGDTNSSTTNGNGEKTQNNGSSNINTPKKKDGTTSSSGGSSGGGFLDAIKGAMSSLGDVAQTARYENKPIGTERVGNIIDRGTSKFMSGVEREREESRRKGAANALNRNVGSRVR